MKKYDIPDTPLEKYILYKKSVELSDVPVIFYLKLKNY